jgi:HD-GYP domain-containing protein (c-di-GMP phosphodiesterase class II)
VNELFEEEAEELVPLDEGDFTPDETVLMLPSVEHMVRNYKSSSYPCFVLDSSLQFVWRNDSFHDHLPDISSTRSNLVTYFPDTFGERDRGGLFTSLRSANTGFSWRGVVQLYERNKPKLIAHLLLGPVLPLIEDAADVPQAYMGIVDDISDHQRDLVRATFSSLLEASLLKDNDTGHHVSRVNEYSRIISELLSEQNIYHEVDYEFINSISFVAAMHDVGKIGTPDDILNKTGSLESWEWDVMREHTKNGAYILGTYPAPMAKQIALFHHERWDGTGYPYELAGDMIPLEARIVALADVYDALRMERAYKPAFEHDKACGEIEQGIESHFDPELAELFLENAEVMRDVYERFKDT